MGPGIHASPERSSSNHQDNNALLKHGLDMYTPAQQRWCGGGTGGGSCGVGGGVCVWVILDSPWSPAYPSVIPSVASIVSDAQCQLSFSALKAQCKEALNIIRVVAHLKWGVDRDTIDAGPDHCSFVARLWMYCVWHSIQNQFTTTWQHPQCWAKTGTWGVLHQPSLQYVHGGKRSFFGGMSVEAVHELLSENSCLHWQPSTPCATWTWPNHKRSVLSKAKLKRRNDPTPGPTHWSESRGSHDLCRDWFSNCLPPEDTNLSTRNTWIRSEETQPHWRGEQMYDHKIRGSGQIQRALRCSRTTW